MKQEEPPRSPLIWPIGAAGLLLAAAASWMLAAHAVMKIAIPGCGPGSACDQIAAGPWGSIPLGAFAWPTSFLGTAYFTAALAAWMASRGTLAGVWKWLIRLGVAASVLLIAVMIVESRPCPYCIAVHAGNIVFWIAAERSSAAARSRGSWVIFIVIFAAVSLALEFWSRKATHAAAQQAEQQRAESASQIIQESIAPTMARKPVTGRWRQGPEAAPIRIVVFSDFQCVDCNRVERELREIMAARTDVSITARHFPFCPPCNPQLQTPMHPNACWAARAAEAAGELRGNDGFWAMHHWLFDKQGGFTDAEINAHLQSEGYDVAAFSTLMQSEGILKRVQADVEEATALGLHYTPMIFINGVEMKGWTIPGALKKTIEQVAATHPPARTAEGDIPATAVEKYVSDWRDQPPLTLPLDSHPRATGADDFKVRIVVWGDYREPNTAKVNSAIGALLAARSDLRYEFRHFPFDKDCNNAVPETKHPGACLAARAAEAAGMVGGPDAFWEMHRWLMTQPAALDEAALLAAIAPMQLDAERFRALLSDAGKEQAVQEDIAAARQLGIRSIPMIIVNNRLVPRWQLDETSVLDRIVDEAAKP